MQQQKDGKKESLTKPRTSSKEERKREMEKTSEAFKVKISDFRVPNEDYWNHIFFKHSTTRQQVSPFILVDLQAGKIQSTKYSGEMLAYPPETEVLNAWPGQYRTDIFTFKVKEALTQHAKYPK